MSQCEETTLTSLETDQVETKLLAELDTVLPDGVNMALDKLDHLKVRVTETHNTTSMIPFSSIFDI
jgi:hypothetical protein